MLEMMVPKKSKEASKILEGLPFLFTVTTQETQDNLK